MPELFTVSTPHAALQKLLDHLSRPIATETIPTATALNRVLIDALVYQLYGLTDDEIKIVEA